MKRMYHLLVLICFVSVSSWAQPDTIRVCSYNILNYGNTANPVVYKNARLQPVLQAIRPAITCFNEIATTSGLTDSLYSVFPFATAHGPVHNTTNTNQLDALFWQQDKFGYLRDTIIANDIRDIVAYWLYYDYPGLARYRDTLKLVVVTAHFKSSNTTADRLARAGEAQKVAAYLSRLPDSSNVMLLGDLNLYSSNEIAYQNLTVVPDSNRRLYDPAGRPGNWDNNPSFADLHTQSPRLLALTDGGASGGLDSRFDFILVSKALLTGAKGIRYLPQTYTSYGNDGLHFGKSIIDTPANTIVPANIAQALYEASDHLPVTAGFEITPLHILYPMAVAQPTPLQELISVQNPFGSRINIRIASVLSGENLNYQLIAIDGRTHLQGMLQTNGTFAALSVDVPPGIYFLRLADEQGRQAYFRLAH